MAERTPDLLRLVLHAAVSFIVSERDWMFFSPFQKPLAGPMVISGVYIMAF